MSRDLESAAQLKLDLHNSLGRLLSRCYELAKLDPSCSGYWEGEARYWEQQYHEAMKLIDSMINLAAAGRTPARATAAGREIEISNVAGDVIITNITDSRNIVVGKDIDQQIRE